MPILRKGLFEALTSGRILRVGLSAAYLFIFTQINALKARHIHPVENFDRTKIVSGEGNPLHSGKTDIHNIIQYLRIRI